MRTVKESVQGIFYLAASRTKKNVRSDAFGNPFGESIYLILDKQGNFMVGDVVILVTKDHLVIDP